MERFRQQNSRKNRGQTTRSYEWLYAILVIGTALAVAGHNLVNRLIPDLHDINTFLWSKAAYQVFQTGVLYPQWLPQMWYGFGLPIFYFYPPLFYWLTILGQTMGLGTIVSVKIVLVLSLLLGSTFLFLWLKEWTSKISAAVAVGFWIVTPYYLSLIHVRGAFPEFMALNLIPVGLWCITKLWKNPERKKYFVGLVLSIGAIILTHNLTTVVALAVYGIYLAYLYWGEQAKKSLLIYSGLSLVLALLVTSFYWLPAFVYKSAINTAVLTAGKFYYGANFNNPSYLINFWLKQEYGWLTLGIVPAIIFVIGWISFSEVSQNIIRKRLLFWLSVSAILIFLVMPFSMFLWDWIPGINLFQFPSRILGPIGLILAVVLAFLLEALFSKSADKLRVGAVMVLISCVLAWPFTAVRPYPALPDAKDSDLTMTGYFDALTREINRKNDGDAEISPERGALASEYVPRNFDEEKLNGLFEKTINKFTTVNESGERQLEYPELIETANTDSSIEIITNQYLDKKFIITSDTSQTIRINQFEFPTWQIKLNETVVAPVIEPEEPGQFLDIPAGRNILEMKIIATPPIRWGRILSLLGLILIGWMGLLAPKFAKSAKLVAYAPKRNLERSRSGYFRRRKTKRGKPAS